MNRHGDRYRQGLDNNEYKIKNAIKINRWMARHGDGCRQVPKALATIAKELIKVMLPTPVTTALSPSGLSNST